MVSVMGISLGRRTAKNDFGNNAGEATVPQFLTCGGKSQIQHTIKCTRHPAMSTAQPLRYITSLSIQPSTPTSVQYGAPIHINAAPSHAANSTPTHDLLRYPFVINSTQCISASVSSFQQHHPWGSHATH